MLSICLVSSRTSNVYVVTFRGICRYMLTNFSSVSVTTVIPFDGDFKDITFQTLLIKVMKFQVAAKLV